MIPLTASDRPSTSLIFPTDVSVVSDDGAFRIGISGLKPTQHEAIRDYYEKMLCNFLHPNSNCDCNAGHIWARCFRSSMRIYLLLYFIVALLTKRHPVYIVKRCLPASLRSSVFIATHCSLYCRVACFMIRAIRNIEYYRTAFFVGSAVSSFATIFIEKSSRRRELAVYVSNQAAETIFKLFLSRGYFTYTPFRAGKRILFALAMGTLFYFYNWSNQDLAPSVSRICRILLGSHFRPTASSDATNVHQKSAMEQPILSLENKSLDYLRALFAHIRGDTTPDQESSNVTCGGDLVIGAERSVRCEISAPVDQNDVEIFTLNDDNRIQLDSSLLLPCSEEDRHLSEKPQSGDRGLSDSNSESTLPDNIEELIPARSSYRVMFLLSGFVRGFFFGYFVRSSSSLFPRLFSPIWFLRNYRQVLKKSFGKTAIRSGLFTSVLVGVSRLIQGLLATLLPRDHPLVDFAGGCIGGGCAATVQTSTEITLYAVGKAVEALIQRSTRLKTIPILPLSVELIYSFSTSLLLYASFLEPWTLRNSYKLFLSRATAKLYDNLVQSEPFTDVRLMTGMQNLKVQYLKYKRA